MSRVIQIYALVDPSSDDVRYVGQSVKASKRLSWHKSAARRGCKGRVYNWVRKLQKEGREPYLLFLEECSESQADVREMYWISHYREIGELCNVTDGGGGLRGFRHSQYFKDKLSNIHSGKVVSEETKLRISTSKSGITLSEEHKQKISKGMKGREVSDSNRQKISVRMRGNQYCKGLKRSSEDKFNKSLVQRGEKSCFAKLTNSDAEEVRKLTAQGIKQSVLAKRFKVSRAAICRIVAKKTYKT